MRQNTILAILQTTFSMCIVCGIPAFAQDVPTIRGTYLERRVGETIQERPELLDKNHRLGVASGRDLIVRHSAGGWHV